MAKLSVLNKVMLILTMYIGRVGPVTFLFAFSRYRATLRDCSEKKVGLFPFFYHLI